VLERARKAEAETVTLKAQLKAETTNSKKSLRDMEAALAESTALSSKSEREYITLRDTLKGMKATWRTDVEGLREDMRKREERLKGEAEAAGKKYAKLLEESKARKADAQNVEQLREQDARIRRKLEEEFREQILALQKEVQSSSQASQKAEKTAQCVSSSTLPSPPLFVGVWANSYDFFHAGTWRVSWLACEDLCSLPANQCLKVHPRSIFFFFNYPAATIPLRNFSARMGTYGGGFLLRNTDPSDMTVRRGKTTRGIFTDAPFQHILVQYQTSLVTSFHYFNDLLHRSLDK
jgi:hypothetical protein